MVEGVLDDPNDKAVGVLTPIASCRVEGVGKKEPSRSLARLSQIGESTGLGGNGKADWGA